MKDFIPCNEALELKELGFDEECFGFWYHETQKLMEFPYSKAGKYKTLAPTYSQAFDWFEKNFGLYVEWLIEGWGDDECISDPIYRIFIWEVGKPKPSPSDDLGAGSREDMNPEILRGLIQIAKLGPNWDSLNGFEMDELD